MKQINCNDRLHYNVYREIYLTRYIFIENAQKYSVSTAQVVEKYRLKVHNIQKQIRYFQKIINVNKHR